MFGLDYGAHVKTLARETLYRLLTERDVLSLYETDLENNEVAVESILDAHGGITYANRCAEINQEQFEQAKKCLIECGEHALRYPRGKAAEYIREWNRPLESYDTWSERVRQTSVCHVAAAGEPDHVWWFGFDCAHAGDYCPKYARLSSIIPVRRCEGIDGEKPWPAETYKTVKYVTAEVERLAKQLAALAP